MTFQNFGVSEQFSHLYFVAPFPFKPTHHSLTALVDYLNLIKTYGFQRPSTVMSFTPNHIKIANFNEKSPFLWERGLSRNEGNAHRVWEDSPTNVTKSY